MLDIGLNTKELPSFSKLWIFPAAIQSSEVIEQEWVPLQLTPTAQWPKMASLSELGQRTNWTVHVYVIIIHQIFLLILQVIAKTQLQAIWQLARKWLVRECPIRSCFQG